MKCRYVDDQNRCDVELRKSLAYTKCKHVNFLDECKRNEIILEWIEEEQRDREGIYPWKLAEEVACEFSVSVSEALELVTKHIKKVIWEV